MNEELQLKLGKEIWEDCKGRLDVIVYFERRLNPEEALALEELLRRGVIKRSNGYNYKICPETKKFLDNGGKTERELEQEEEKRRKEEELKIAKDANRISIISMIFSGFAIIISILSYLKE